MRDLCGNPLAEGQMVMVRSLGVIGHIIQVDVPALENRPPRIVLAIAIPVNISPNQSPVNFRVEDIIRVVDPNTTAAVEGMLAGNPSRKDGMPQ